MATERKTVAQWRAERGLTQRALADAAGVHYTMIARWEQGVFDPRASHLRAIADALGVTMDAIELTGRGTRKRPGRPKSDRGAGSPSPDLGSGEEPTE